MADAKRKLPEVLYLETWPEGCGRRDMIHFEQLGYGVDMATGATSTITRYERVTKARRLTKAKVRRG